MGIILTIKNGKIRFRTKSVEMSKTSE